MKLSAHELKYFNYVKIEKQIIKQEDYRQEMYDRIIVHYIKERRFLPPMRWSKTFEFKRSSKPSDRKGYISYIQDDEFLELRDQLKAEAEKNTVTITREQYEAESENFELRSKVTELQNKILDAAENHI